MGEGVEQGRLDAIRCRPRGTCRRECRRLVEEATARRVRVAHRDCLATDQWRGRRDTVLLGADECLVDEPLHTVPQPSRATPLLDAVLDRGETRAAEDLAAVLLHVEVIGGATGLLIGGDRRCDNGEAEPSQDRRHLSQKSHAI
eukprot:scaffold42301_cov27-Tisochrysis_lutea.AAC.5